MRRDIKGYRERAAPQYGGAALGMCGSAWGFMPIDIGRSNTDLSLCLVSARLPM